ncbi:MAG: DUF1801 domain-containing protein [Bacteroidota bacterium]
MTKLKTANETEQVNEYIAKLDPAIAEVVERLRKIILSVDKQIGEQLKWNSPAFYYTGDMKPFNPKEYKRDIVVMNLHRGNVLLVFPTGAKVVDTTGLLEGNYTDGRRIVNIKDLDDAKLKEKSLIKVLKQWLELVE